MDEEAVRSPLDELIDASIALCDRVWEERSNMALANGLAVAYFTARLPEVLSRVSAPPPVAPPISPQP
jgi:hypothetical protein